MATIPNLVIHLGKISHNARRIVDVCKRWRIRPFGVVKACSGHFEIAAVFLRGGFDGIADVSPASLRKLQERGIPYHRLMCLRSSVPPDVGDVAGAAAYSLQSVTSIIHAFAGLTSAPASAHRLILMADIGDLREGAWWRDEFVELCRTAAEAEQRWGREIVGGLGTNVACFQGILPTAEVMERLRFCVETAEHYLHRPIGVISGGNSSALHYLWHDASPPQWVRWTNQLRIGESVLLGRDTVDRSALPGLYQDAFIICAPILEIHRKPGRTQGPFGPGAFDLMPRESSPDRRRRAVVAIGRQEIGAGSLVPLEPGVQFVGATSDHSVFDVESAGSLAMGQAMSFIPDYGALTAIMVNGHIAIQWVHGPSSNRPNSKESSKSC